MTDRPWRVSAQRCEMQEVERIKSLQGPGGRLPKRVPEQ
jgi:hypothetical protein